MSLQLLQAGACTMIVDGGRVRTRHLGVPVGGAGDRAAWQLANALVGNPPSTPALEIALSGPVLTTGIPITLAFFGADFPIQIDSVQTLSRSQVFQLLPGERLVIASARRGMRGYLAVAGGIRSESILNSQSNLEPMKSGTTLDVESIPTAIRSLPTASVQELFGEIESTRLRIVPGPQFDWFQRNELSGQAFRVSVQSNRMGVRLEGKPLTRPSREMVSEAVAPGAIQITNEGLPIVLGVDGQTIGGYPKIGHIIEADLDRLAQIRPNQIVEFEWVDTSQAASLTRIYRKKLKEWLIRLEIAERLPARFR